MNRTVVITGGIGSGKSLVSSFLAGMGVPVYDSDSRTKSLYARRPELMEGIRGIFGTDDLRQVAVQAFSDREKLERLERLVHPAVYRDFEEWKATFPDEDFVVFESAIILDREYPEGFADAVVYVTAPEDLRLARAIARDHADADAVRARMSRQTDRRDDSRVTYVIENAGSPEELEIKVKELYNLLKNEN